MRTVESKDESGFVVIDAYVGDTLVARARQSQRGWWCDDIDTAETPPYRALNREDALVFLGEMCNAWSGGS